MNIEALFAIFSHFISQMTGVLARIRLPKPLNTLVLRTFCAMYCVDYLDAEKPLNEYKSLAEFFERSLSPQARTLNPSSQIKLSSPIDGVWREARTLDGAAILTVKNKRYFLKDFLGSQELATQFEGGWLLNFYLSPRDYHHVHSPFDFDLHSIRHIPGAVFPVSKWSVGSFPWILFTNERVVLNGTIGNKAVSVILIGALNVGSITIPAFPGLFKSHSRSGVVHQLENAKSVKRGDLLGSFHLGSSAVILIENELASTFQIKPLLDPKAVKLYEALHN